MSDFDLTQALTKRRFLAAFADFPDDEPILINVEFGSDGDNWDTFVCEPVDQSYLCPGCSDKHEEPLMAYEGVLFVKFTKPLK